MAMHCPPMNERLNDEDVVVADVVVLDTVVAVRDVVVVLLVGVIVVDEIAADETVVLPTLVVVVEDTVVCRTLRMPITLKESRRDIYRFKKFNLPMEC